MIPSRVIGWIDDGVGGAVESATRWRHGRRLGPARADPVLRAQPAWWAATGSPPRDGNDFDVLIDGATVFPAIVDAVRDATSHVHLAFWAIDAGFALVRGPQNVTLRSLLAEAAERVDVRLLLWRGAPVPAVHPWWIETRRALRRLTEGTRIRAAVDSTSRWTGACHEKVVVVDGTHAFVGGLDPTTQAGDRFDVRGHPTGGQGGWHDACARVRGPVVADVAAHFALRWRAATGEALPPAGAPAPNGRSRVQVVRTVPERAYAAVADGEFSALEAHLAAVRAAQRSIHIETQFLSSVELVDALVDKLSHPPRDDFRVVAVLPVRPRGALDETRGQLRRLRRADAGAGRLAACSLRGGRAGGPGRVYVHAKVMIVDDAWVSIGSVNLSDHSMFNATEVQLVSDDAQPARATREALWSEHLGLDLEVVRGADPDALFDRYWRRLADEQLEREQRGAGVTARIVRIPALSRRSGRAVGALQNLMRGS